MTFAVITPALIVGAYVERVGFGFVLCFRDCGCCCAMRLWCIGFGAAVSWPMAVFLATRARAIRRRHRCSRNRRSGRVVDPVFLGPRKNRSVPPQPRLCDDRRRDVAGLAGSGSTVVRNWPLMVVPPWP